jgi:C-terminal processing protease CtpA/Prc
MSDVRRFITGVVALTLSCAALSAQQPSTNSQECAAPLISGICDPFVPGTIIGGSPDRQTINVYNTWPDGPAEKAGICPGDQIVAVDGVPVPGHNIPQMLKEIVSPTSSPITLKVKRGGQEMEFHFDRVRESTLALLSHERYMLLRKPFEGFAPSTVPFDETPEELRELLRFYDGIDRRLGLKFIEGMDVPEGTPEEQVEKLAAIQPGGREENRWVTATPIALTQNSSIPGFVAVLLKNPEVVLVNVILPGSAAQHAGLFPGDQILEVNAHSVAGLNEGQLSDLILKPDEPREISLKVRRASSTVSLKIQAQKFEESAVTKAFRYVPDHREPMKSDSYVLGVHVLYAENPREAMVDEVDYPSPAFDAGILIGDRVLEASGVPMEQITLEQLHEMLKPQGASELRLMVSRLGKKLEVKVKPATFAEVQAKIGRKITKGKPMPVHCPET